MADDLQQIPAIEVEPSSAPFELPATHKICPDCEREVPAKGITYPRDPLRPLSEFYEIKAKRYTNGKRHSAYCRPHHLRRIYEQRKEKRKNPEDRAHLNQLRNATVARSGYEQRPERKAQKRKNAASWRERNRELNSSRASAWVKTHKKRHAESARRSYHRRHGQQPTTDQALTDKS